MTVTFAEKLARIPHYEPGRRSTTPRPRAETADAVKLASNESPFPPHPDVVEAITRAAAGVNGTRTRGPGAAQRDRRAPRDGPGRGSRSPTAPARSCSPPPLALCEPGDEIVYAWPSFSMYPHLPALSGAREIRVPLSRRRRPRPRRDARAR